MQGQTVHFPRKMNRWPKLLVRQAAPLPETAAEGASESLAPPDPAGGSSADLLLPLQGPLPLARSQRGWGGGGRERWHPAEPQLSLLQLRDSLPCFPPPPGTSLQGAALMGDAKRTTTQHKNQQDPPPCHAGALSSWTRLGSQRD